MSFAGQVDFLRDGVRGGLISEDDAVQLAAEISEGGVTRLGARDLLTDPRSATERYKAVGRGDKR